MQYSLLLTLAIATLSAAKPGRLQARAGVFGTQTYDELSVSGGVAGNALAEVDAKLAILDDLANVDPADIVFLGDVNGIANDAEVGVFNPAIDAATGQEKIELQNGKIKNKVLKLRATVLALEAKAAQGEDTSVKLAKEQKKLDKNVALDVAAAGQPSTFLSFDAVAGGGSVGGGNSTAGK